jgi:isoprenylcysteine carboxyl methyltransferase (ICMT) family protein YpbQ
LVSESKEPVSIEGRARWRRAPAMTWSSQQVANGFGRTETDPPLLVAGEQSHTAEAVALPCSCTVSWINYAGAASLVGTTLVLSRIDLPITTVALATLTVAALTIIILENLFMGPRIAFRPITSRGYRVAQIGASPLRRVALKLLGLTASIAALALLYWLFPIYRATGAKDLFSLTQRLWLPFLICTPLYIWYVDKKSVEPEDSFFHLGLLCTGCWNLVDLELIKQHCLQWLVKAFFLPLIVGFYFGYLAWLPKQPFDTDVMAFLATPSSINWLRISDFLVRYLLMIDVGFGCIGYLLTLKLLDAEVRSTEPKLLGWLVCLVCYAPFWGLISENYLKYGSGTLWDVWLADWPTVKVIWSVLILLLTLVYLSATIQFGIRFSNLSHRGIITNGPYRWLKHPAYVAKNINWWLIYLPFLSSIGFTEGIRLSVLLVGVNTIYYLRAKTEEAHLSVDPIYQQYLEFMRNNGLFARARHIFVRRVQAFSQSQ